MKRLIIDTHNVLFRIAAMNSKLSGTAEEKAGLALHSSLMAVNKYYKQFQPDQLIFTFEGRNNWRKSFTSGEDSLTERVYKANRPRDKSLEPFFELINTFREVMTQYSSAVCVWDDSAEADDVIGCIAEKYSGPDDEIIIISSDKDFIQLLQYENVRVVDPASGKDREHEDVHYFIFEKCIRGDSGDNVGSAFPRVRSTRIKQAYEDDYYRVQFMNEEWTDKITGNTYRVGDLFEENEKLMILDCQPDEVRESVFNSIEHHFENVGQYNNFQFMKFLGKYKLQKISENIHLYLDMLTSNSLSWKQSLQSNVTSGDDINKDVDDHFTY